MNERYKSSMDHIVTFVSDYSKRLSRPIKVLNTVIIIIIIIIIIMIGSRGC